MAWKRAGASISRSMMNFHTFLLSSWICTSKTLKISKTCACTHLLKQQTFTSLLSSWIHMKHTHSQQNLCMPGRLATNDVSTPYCTLPGSAHRTHSQSANLVHAMTFWHMKDSHTFLLSSRICTQNTLTVNKTCTCKNLLKQQTCSPACSLPGSAHETHSQSANLVHAHTF